MTHERNATKIHRKYNKSMEAPDIFFTEILTYKFKIYVYCEKVLKLKLLYFS